MKLISAILLLVLSIVFITCKKENRKYCWQVVDHFGNHMMVVCDKTEAEMTAKYACFYFKTGGAKYCWMINNNFFSDITEAEVNMLSKCFMGNNPATKINCDHCKSFYNREKRMYKPTNGITYSTVKFERFCGDTAKTLFHGREVVVRNTADSLITVQFSSNGMF